MASYDYRCECGEVVERVAKMGSAPRKAKCPVCGKMAGRSWESFPSVQCRYSYMVLANGNPRVNRGKG